MKYRLIARFLIESKGRRLRKGNFWFSSIVWPNSPQRSSLYVVFYFTFFNVERRLESFFFLFFSSIFIINDLFVQYLSHGFNKKRSHISLLKSNILNCSLLVWRFVLNNRRGIGVDVDESSRVRCFRSLAGRKCCHAVSFKRSRHPVDALVGRVVVGVRSMVARQFTEWSTRAINPSATNAWQKVLYFIVLPNSLSS